MARISMSKMTKMLSRTYVHHTHVTGEWKWLQGVNTRNTWRKNYTMHARLFNRTPLPEETGARVTRIMIAVIGLVLMVFVASFRTWSYWRMVELVTELTSDQFNQTTICNSAHATYLLSLNQLGLAKRLLFIVVLYCMLRCQRHRWLRVRTTCKNYV